MGKVDNVLLRDHFSTMEEPEVKCARRTNAVLACYPGREERSPVREAQLRTERRTVEDRAALPSQAVTPGLFVHIRAMFYSAHLEMPQHKQVCLQKEAETSIEFCSFSDLVEPCTFLDEK